MKVLLDTQIIYLSATNGTLSRKAKQILEDPNTERCISAATLMEIAIKNASGQLVMSESQVRQALADLCITVLPFAPEHAYKLFSLPPHHRDPFDRMIIATALAEDIPLIGAHRLFKKYRGLKVIWQSLPILLC